MKSIEHKPPGGRDDEELMERFQQGEASAMDELVSRYSRPIYGFLCRQTGSRDMADDLYQEVFLKVIRAARTYRSDSRFSAWIFTVARNACIDQSRRDFHRRTDSLDVEVGEEGGGSRLEKTADPGPTPEETARASELAVELEDALSSLSEEQREVFLLRERAGLSFKEIAKATDAPLNTVKTRMHYALRHLRHRLEEKGFFAG